MFYIFYHNFLKLQRKTKGHPKLTLQLRCRWSASGRMIYLAVLVALHGSMTSTSVLYSSGLSELPSALFCSLSFVYLAALSQACLPSHPVCVPHHLFLADSLLLLWAVALLLSLPVSRPLFQFSLQPTSLPAPRSAFYLLCATLCP